MIGSGETSARMASTRTGKNGWPEPDSAFRFSRSKLVRHAYGFASRAHVGQLQESDGRPYIEHPAAVARLLQRAGFREEVVAAGLLHDTVESTSTQIEDIEKRFGPDVAGLVHAMTEPKRPEDFRARKAAHRQQMSDADCEAAAVFAADKIANTRNLREALAKKGEERLRRRLSKPFEQKIEHYRNTLDMLDELARPLSLIPQLRQELDGLAADREQGTRDASSAA